MEPPGPVLVAHPSKDAQGVPGTPRTVTSLCLQVQCGCTVHSHGFWAQLWL